jgi:acetyltransferase-like isoleucine patch superfamily enzyme
MEYLPDKAQYLLRTVFGNPSELLRIARVAWTSFRFRWIQRCVGKNTVVGEGTVMVNSANIEIGSGCLIKDRVYMRAGIAGSIVIDDGAALNSFVQMYGHGGIKIGKNAQLGPNTVVTTTGHDYLSGSLETEYAGISIGEGVWIGANCTIIGGVHIGDQAVIGAGAVVTKNIPPRCVAVGVPARVVRSFDEPETADEYNNENNPD